MPGIVQTLKLAQALAVENGYRIEKAFISSDKYRWAIIKSGQLIAICYTGEFIVKTLEALKAGKEMPLNTCEPSHKYNKKYFAVCTTLASESVNNASTTPAWFLALTEEKVEETATEVPVVDSEVEVIAKPAIAPTVVTSHLKPQFQVKADLSIASKQELKQQVLALLNLQTASQAARWAKEQGMVVDLCYKSHWAAVLEKAQETLAVAA